MNFHSGFIKKEDFTFVQNSTLFKRLEVDNDSFKSHFSSKLGDYRRKWTDDSLHLWSRVWEYPYIYSMLEQKLRSNQPMRVLDAGCGLSFFPFKVQKDFPHVEVFGTDYDPDLVQGFDRVNASIDHKVKFQLGDLRKLDFPDGAFDVIYCLSVLEHTDAYRAIADNFHRLLKPGGHLILTFDVSLDGDKHVPIPEARELLSYVSQKFRPLHPAEEISESIKTNHEILTTRYVAEKNKALLPWRAPWKNAVKNLLRGKKPRLVYNLACYCQVFERR